MGTRAAWAIGATASERDEATSPSSATTRFWLISLVAAVAASSGLDWSSSLTTLIFLPRTPPAAFTSSKAREIPLWVDWPKVAVVPVKEPYSPTTISFLSTGAAHARAKRASAAGAASRRRLVMSSSMLDPRGLW